MRGDVRLPPDAAAIAALGRLVQELCAAGAFAEAEAPAKELAERVRRSPDGEVQPDFVRVLLWQAVIQQEMGNRDRTEALLRRAVEIAQTLRPSTFRLQAEVSAQLAAFYDRAGRYAEAAPLFERALARLGPSVDVSDPDRASIAGLRRQVLDRLADRAAGERLEGRYDVARSTLEEMRRLAVARFGETSIEHAESLKHLGGLARMMGSHGAEVAFLEAGLKIAEAAVADPDPRVADLHARLAEAHVETGAYADAERHYLRALDIHRRSPEAPDKDRANALRGLSLLYLRLSRLPQAQPLLEEYLAIERTRRESRPIDYAIAANHVGLLFHQLGRAADAEPLFLEALAIARAEPDKTDLTYVTSLMSLMRHYYDTRQLAKAGPLWQEAVEFINANVGTKHPAVHVLLMSENVRMLLDAGLFARAEAFLRQQLDFLGSGVPARRALALDQLGRVCAATGRPAEALEAFTEAARIDDALAGEVFSISSEADRLEHVETIRARYERFLSLVVASLAGSAEATRAALDLVLRRKAIVAEVMAAQREVILGGRQPEQRETLATIAALRQEAARLAFARDASEGAAERRRDLQARREELERELARRAPGLDLERPPRDLDAAAIAAALPAAAALVEFVRYRQFAFAAAPLRGEAPWAAARYLAFVVVGGGADRVQMVDLGDGEAIDRLIEEFRSAVTGERAAPAGTDGSRLRAAVFDPLGAALGRTRRLFIAPDGDLSRLPFETLPDIAGRPLLEEYRISYLSAGRDLLRLGSSASAPAADPIVIAFPDFDLRDRALPAAPETRRSRDVRGQGIAFPPLPGTRGEGESVAALLRVRPWMGKDALEARLKTCRSPRILHLATHGFFLGDQATGAAGFTGTALENPLLRSGLALAGANTWLNGGSPPVDAEDGLLTAEDVSGLDLLGTDMVVLSACQTGLGEIRVGEGVFGLRRAFVLAGARTLVMSLWKVPDAQTCELMEDFYRRLLAGAPRAEALRAAQLAIRDRYREVRFWGAFICQGDPGPLPVRPTMA